MILFYLVQGDYLSIKLHPIKEYAPVKPRPAKPLQDATSCCLPYRLQKRCTHMISIAVDIANIIFQTDFRYIFPIRCSSLFNHQGLGLFNHAFSHLKSLHYFVGLGFVALKTTNVWNTFFFCVKQIHFLGVFSKRMVQVC